MPDRSAPMTAPVVPRRLLGTAGCQVRPAQPTLRAVPPRLPDHAVSADQAGRASRLAGAYPGTPQQDRTSRDATVRHGQAGRVGTGSWYPF
jgi:hypothetical protein